MESGLPLSEGAPETMGYVEEGCEGAPGSGEDGMQLHGDPAAPIESHDASLTDPKQLSTHEFLNCSVQQLVADINAKRKRDTALLEDFKKELDMHCNAVYASVEAAMYHMYERNHKAIQEKLHELFAVLDRIAKQEQELEDFKSALGALYSDIQGPPL